ncbi:unnamed protein product [Taenia asiatica]|uniref:V-type proton ATPase subunit G n=1 Tax=Taenia asiatica TaxID=60517 RepID=A0A0R3WCU8_TAEAS|nr:unnamed protein product [Taenia asiatica]
MASVTQLDGVAQLQVAKAAATAKIEEARTSALPAYSKHDSETSGRVEAFTEEAIRKLQQRYEENRESALSGIIAQVLTVNPTAHRNVKNT